MRKRSLFLSAAVSGHAVARTGCPSVKWGSGVFTDFSQTVPNDMKRPCENAATKAYTTRFAVFQVHQNFGGSESCKGTPVDVRAFAAVTSGIAWTRVRGRTASRTR
jgi:hypothetical protein